MRRLLPLFFVLLLLLFAGIQVVPRLNLQLQPSLAEGLRLDYKMLVRLTLPGAGFEGQEKEEAGVQAGKDVNGGASGWTLSDYAQYLLYSELSGMGEAERLPSSPVEGETPAEMSGEHAAPEISPEQEHLFLQNEEFIPGEDSLSLAHDQEPLVLVFHSHTTESFLPEAGEPFTTELDQTVVVLGEKLSLLLEETYGIPTLHCREIFDIPRRDAYKKARPKIQTILDENPQVEVVIDLHRDGVSREVTTASLQGKETGRLLFVIGSRHEGWYSNMRFALFLQGELESNYPELNRGVRQHNFTYNQDLHPRSVLVEVGGYKNSLAEVKRSIPFLAEIIACSFEG